MIHSLHIFNATCIMSTKLICRVCLKIVEEDKHMYLNTSYMNEIDRFRSLAELLQECVSEVNLQLTDSPLICHKCLVLLKSTIHFKEVCSRTEEQVYNYMTFNDCLEESSIIDLKEVIELKKKLEVLGNVSVYEKTYDKKPYLREENSSYVENVELMCRTCLKEIQGSNFKYLNDVIDIYGCQNLVKILEECVSLICLQSTNSLLICNECNEMLKNTYAFKQMCCETEEELYKFMKLHDFYLDESPNIELIDVLNMKNKFQFIQDNSSTQDKELNQIENNTTITDIISDQSNINSLRIKKEALKLANTRTLYLNKDTLSDDSPRSNRKKSKVLSPKLNPKISKLQAPKSVQKESKSVFRSRHFKCKKCQYKAYRIDLLIRHKLKCKNRFKNEEEIYNKKCQYCSKKFSRNAHLKRHEYIHTLVSNYVCEKCGNVFAEKYQLNNHEARHNQSEGPHKCNHCNKTFFRKCDLNAHMKKTVLKGGRLMCTYCKKEFYDKRDRLSHISKYHTSEELPFKCNSCSFSTAYSKRFHSHKMKCNMF